MPKMPLNAVIGTKMPGYDRQSLHHVVQAIGDGGEVSVEYAAHEVTVRVDDLIDLIEVVVHVAEVDDVSSSRCRRCEWSNG